MQYSEIIKILNTHIIQGEKSNLLRKLGTDPERYIGIFRPTKPQTKLIQNLLQSHEIRFGDAVECLFREIITSFGFVNLPRVLVTSDGIALSLDQFFTDGKRYIIMEQKIRDDHDSSKKRGQIKNFEAKIDLLYRVHHENLIGIFYFIDPNISKNKYYYIREIDRLKEIYNIELYLFYGQDFFDYIKHSDFWTILIGWIKKWTDGLPDIPEINFDLSPNSSFEEIKTLEPKYWRKLLENETIWKDGIIRVLFANGTTLKLIFSYFSQQQTPVYHELAKALLEKINKYYY